MSNIYDIIWPSGVPTGLWTAPISGEKRTLPFMDITIHSDFVFACVVGAVILIMFGWNRFNQPTYPENGNTNRILDAVSPTRMRGQSAMMYAYGGYITVMLAVYIALTFFGELILTFGDTLGIAGIQVNAETLDLDTPAWPLALALGFVGLAPILPPVAYSESWLRKEFHERFGIPSRLKEHSEKLVIHVSELLKEQSSIEKEMQAAPPWLKESLENYLDRGEAFRLKEELKLLVHWCTTSLGWPKHSERQDLSALLRQIVQQARECIEEFDDLNSVQTLNHSKPVASSTPATVGQGFSDVLFNYGGPSDSGGRRAREMRRKNLEQRFVAVLGQMRTVRNEMATILALYAERDTNFDSISYNPGKGEPDIRTTMSAVFPETYVASPAPGLLMLVPFVFAIFAVGVAYRAFSPLGSFPLNSTTVLVTAFLGTLNYLAIVAAPIMAAFYWRYRMIDTGQWDKIGGLGKIFYCGGLALLVSAATSAALAVLWGALVSDNAEQLRQTLFGEQSPLLWYHVVTAGIAATIACFAVRSEEIDRNYSEKLSNLPDGTEPPSRRGVRVKRSLLGLVSGLCVIVLILLHRGWHFQTSFLPLAICTPDEALSQSASLWQFLPPLLSPAYLSCLTKFAGLDLVLFPIAAFLACTPLMNLSIVPRS